MMAAKHRIEMLKEILADDVQFKDYGLVSTFDLPHNGELDEAHALGQCVTTVMQCDAIYLDHGWTASKGCNLEYRTAKIYGKQIFEHDNL